MRVRDLKAATHESVALPQAARAEVRSQGPEMQRAAALLPAVDLRARKSKKLREGETLREVTLVYDPGPQREVSNVAINGSWNKETGRFSREWGRQTIPMQRMPDGTWQAKVRVIDDGHKHDWEWGVLADTPGKKQHWAVHGTGNLKLNPAQPTASYAPTTYHRMGARKGAKGDLNLRLWQPDAQSVVARITKPDGTVERIPLERDGEEWFARVRGGFAAVVGASYVYEIKDGRGQDRVAADPYAFETMGEQRGISRMYFDPSNGSESHPYKEPHQGFTRFEIADHIGADEAYLVLKDENGAPLNRDQVLARIGELDAGLRAKITQQRLVDDLASVGDDGRLAMRATDGVWTTILQKPEALSGLRYELQLWKRDGSGTLKLHGDADGNGSLDAAERRSSLVNDAYDDRITDMSGLAFRESIIVDAVSPSVRYVPPKTPWNQATIYQAHVGSFMSTSLNSRRSTFADLIAQLDHLDELGINTIELLPVTEEQGVRGWGYAMGVVNFATENSLGFVRDGRWVSGREALAMLGAEARKRGISLICDVVYNHSLEKGNPLLDISANNPYYNWGNADHPQLRMTPWGPMPAFNKPRVRQFLIDHAIAQLTENGFQGIRFDFTQPIYEQGGEDGRKFLEELVSQIREVAPESILIPEDFSFKDWIVDLMGSLWYTEYQHRLVHDHDLNRPGLVQAAALGLRTNIDRFLQVLVDPFGLKSMAQSITMISNHDEVGNAARTVMVAQGKTPSDDPPQRARNLARLTMLVGQMSPGVPFIFQGDESLATNKFTWGISSTWPIGWTWKKLGADWDWNALKFNDAVRETYTRLFGLGDAALADPAFAALADADKRVYRDLAALSEADRRQALVDISRRQTFEFSKASMAMRKDAKAFADVPAAPVFAHNDHGVFAFLRGDDHVVVGNVKDAQRNYAMYLPEGKWREVVNSDDVRFGGEGVVNTGRVIQGGQGAVIDLPAGGALVLERVE